MVLWIGRLSEVPVDIEGLRTYSDFEVIDLVDEKNTYHVLLDIYWVINNQEIINFKKRILSFKDYEIRVVAPIDPLEGQWYVDPVHSEGQENYLYQLYNIMSSWEYYINPTNDGNLSWCSISSCTFDLGETLENWQNMLHEVSMCRSVRITWVVRRVGAEASMLPTYEGFPNLSSFLE